MVLNTNLNFEEKDGRRQRIRVSSSNKGIIDSEQTFSMPAEAATPLNLNKVPSACEQKKVAILHKIS